MPDDIDSHFNDDRIAGFSIAAADLLLELDKNHEITFVSGGAGHVWANDPEALVGRVFTAMVSGEDRQRVEDLLASLDTRTKSRPSAIRMAATGAIVVCGACQLPGAPKRTYVTLTTTRLPGQTPMGAAGRDPRTGALSRDQFIGAARDLVFGVGELGVDATLTLLRLPDITAQGEPAEENDPLLTVVTRLRTLSLGDAVGRVSDDIYALVHDGAVEVDRIEEVLADAGAPGGAEARQVRLRPDGLSPQDVANVIAYTMAKFSENGATDFDIDSLAGGMKRLVRETVNRLSVLRQTVINQAFRVVFQPIVSLTSGRVHHYEMLSRFPGGDEPDRTVLFAESIGLIEDLDLAVCRKAIDAVRASSDAGAPVSLAVNISARSLRSNILVGALDQLLSTLGGLRGNVMLEITETDRIEDLPAAEAVLQHFRAAGNPVCLDDFGAGASSFRYFQALTVDYAKIDGAYVRDVPSNKRDAAILRAMVSLCRDLKVKTVAEMVETAEQADTLTKIGIDFGQGWLFGRPKLAIAPAAPYTAGAPVHP